MLGYIQPNNDVYIFFENDEIERLGREKIQGTYFNLNDPSKTGLLEAAVNDAIDCLMKTSANRDENGFWNWLFLEMRSREYHSLKERRTSELPEGFRHICLRDASQQDALNFSDQINYRQLKYWESLQS
ncbi:hypothetical protein HN587_05485 [Candidatus Woesearchaeota archaeon]|jgi:hypothetical protein|nr:hypothetical protein [Candidatus Woesearchaeota archaeon]